MPTAYGLPGSLTAYLPDPTEPVDRWFQARNASNVRTTVRIVRDLCPDADLLVDPLAGGGSSACAARLLGLPFFGVELDPVLACVCAAKSTATASHARALVRGEEAGAEPPVSLLSVALRLSACSDRPTSATDALHDLESGYPAPADASVFWADAAAPAVWRELEGQAGRAKHAVLYTSPPFGLSSPRPEVSEELQADAVSALRSAGLDLAHGGPGEFASYAKIATSAVVNAVRGLGRATVILEHEPNDDGFDAREATGRLLADALGARMQRLRFLECGSYSRRGLFSLIVCEVRP